MALNKKPKTVKLTRKQQRKEKRKEKKVRRNDYYTKRNKTGGLVSNPEKNASDASKHTVKTKEKITKGSKKPVETQEQNNANNKILTTEQVREKEQKEQKRLQKEMNDQRKKQLLEANDEEDKVIRKLEKQLGLKKRKSKTMPKSLVDDGLDFLLEVCDPKTMENAVNSEKDFLEADDVFEEDFALMSKKPTAVAENSDEDALEQSDDEDAFEQSDDEKSGDESDFATDDELMNQDEDDISDSEIEDDINSSLESEEEDDDSLQKKKQIKPSDMKKKDKEQNMSNKKRKTQEPPGKNKRLKTEVNEESDDSPDEDSEAECDEDTEDTINKENVQKGAVKTFADGTWEDIYGRKRAKDGSVITKEKESKYIPPAMRAMLEKGNTEDKKRLERLKKQLKGLLNRLAESNMHGIAVQMEELYMKNSRNDMNDTLTNLIIESLVSEVLTPERLLIEHIVLLTILHANIGTEIGAHFLQHVIRLFDACFNADEDVENKTLDNIVRIVAQLYNFKLFDSKLIYEMLQKFVSRFQEKDVECILHVLRSIGFGLRKDDPLALKNLIMEIQNQAANVSDGERDYTRVKFMMEILLAIKNNNVTKIPNYDTSYSEHLKKVMKSFIRKGNYVSQLNISIEDLLKADERGRWWVVGSAWMGTENDNSKPQDSSKSEGFSSKLLELAKKQRMTTDVRRNIFCIIMSAEDYMDAFQKIVKLGLKNQQEREIINVLLHCCVSEKQYNPYYGFLANKFCSFDRKYQIMIKFAIWDKLKTDSSNLSNLARFSAYLITEKSLPITMLKVIQFGDTQKARFMRQTLLGIMLHTDLDSCISVFRKIPKSKELQPFRESLSLFIHFILKNISVQIPEDQRELVETRGNCIKEVLIGNE